MNFLRFTISICLGEKLRDEKNKKYFTKLFCFTVTAFCSNAASSRVLELSDRFLDVRSEGSSNSVNKGEQFILFTFSGMWFVKFYSPSCGFCKKIEPVWGHVAQALHNTK